MKPNRLYYHVNLLEEHGLIRVTDTRLVSGIVERTYGLGGPALRGRRPARAAGRPQARRHRHAVPRRERGTWARRSTAEARGGPAGVVGRMQLWLTEDERAGFEKQLGELLAQVRRRRAPSGRRRRRSLHACSSRCTRPWPTKPRSDRDQSLRWGATDDRRQRQSRCGRRSARCSALLPKASLRLHRCGRSASCSSARCCPTAFRLATGALDRRAARRGARRRRVRRRRIDVDVAAHRARRHVRRSAGGRAAVAACASTRSGRRLNGHLRARVMAAAALPPGIGHLEDPATLDKVMLAQGVGTPYVTPRLVVSGVFTIAANYVAGIAAGVLLMAFGGGCRGCGRRLPAGHPPLPPGVPPNVQGITGQAETLRRSAYFRDVALTPGAAKETRVFGMADWVVDRFHTSWHGAMVDMWRDRRGQWKTMIIAGGVFFATEVRCDGDARAARRSTARSRSANSSCSSARWVGSARSPTSATTTSTSRGARPRSPPRSRSRQLVQRPDVAASRRHAGRRAAARARSASRTWRFAYPGRDDVFDGLDLAIPAGQSLADRRRQRRRQDHAREAAEPAVRPDRGTHHRRRRAADRDRPRARGSGGSRPSSRTSRGTSSRPTDNVAFGNPDIPVDARGAGRGGASGPARPSSSPDLPHGWDTVLSRQFKDGTDLSGGQWQRLALARALYAVDAGAGVLILDEPTASLDVRAEAELYDRFLELTRGLTTLVISHRFSTVRRADRIVVIEDGRVVEDGSHDELLAARRSLRAHVPSPSGALQRRTGAGRCVRTLRARLWILLVAAFQADPCARRASTSRFRSSSRSPAVLAALWMRNLIDAVAARDRDARHARAALDPRAAARSPASPPGWGSFNINMVLREKVGELMDRRIMAPHHGGARPRTPRARRLPRRDRDPPHTARPTELVGAGRRDEHRDVLPDRRHDRSARDAASRRSCSCRCSAFRRCSPRPPRSGAARSCSSASPSQCASRVTCSRRPRPRRRPRSCDSSGWVPCSWRGTGSCGRELDVMQDRTARAGRERCRPRAGRCSASASPERSRSSRIAPSAGQASPGDVVLAMTLASQVNGQVAGVVADGHVADVGPQDGRPLHVAGRLRRRRERADRR